MSLSRKILGSLIYNKDQATYTELKGLDTLNYFSNSDYSDFYNEVLLPLYRKKLQPPSKKSVELFISKHSHKKRFTKVLEALDREVKKGKKTLSLEDMPQHLDLLKRSNVKEALEERVGDLYERSEGLGLDELEPYLDELKEIAYDADSIVSGDQDEELLLHGAVGAYDIFKEKYELRKASGGTKICDYGYKFLDDSYGGVKTTDMFSILGSAKQFKSTLMRNVAYKALLQAKNIFLGTLEMSFNELEASFLTLHINNRDRFPDFPRITYKEILEGKVPKDKEYYMYKAYQDLVEAEDLGILYIKKPKGDYTTERFTADITKVSTNYMTIDLAMIDSINLMHGGEVNDVDRAIRDLRQFSLGFNNNQGLPIFSPYQIKRSAFTQACATEGNLYDADAVRYFSEVNTSSTRVVTTIQTPEMRETNTVQIQSLLTRDTEDFKPTILRVDGEIGVLEEIANLVKLQESGAITEEVMQEIVEATSVALFDD